jgi:hypothetical protein
MGPSHTSWRQNAVHGEIDSSDQKLNPKIRKIQIAGLKNHRQRNRDDDPQNGFGK